MRFPVHYSSVSSSEPTKPRSCQFDHDTLQKSYEGPGSGARTAYNPSMDSPPTNYDARYLGGILFFNAHDFFQAHEVWEGLWLELAGGPDRRFIQGLIQAAVALYHFGNGNFPGARKLYQTSRGYMEPCGSPYLGLDSTRFWEQMEKCFRPIVNEPEPKRELRPDESLIPKIELCPPPESWPDLADFETEEEDE